MVLVRILMSKSGFEDKVLIKLIVGVVKHQKKNQKSKSLRVKLNHHCTSKKYV
jgi:hypothetical protein